MRVKTTLLALCAMLSACGREASHEQVAAVGGGKKAADAVELQGWVETAPLAKGESSDVAVWANTGTPARSVLVGASREAGLELYTIDGASAGGYTGVDADFVDVHDGFTLRGAQIPLVVTYDRKSDALLAFAIDPASLQVSLVSAQPLKTNAEVTGLCLYRSPLTGSQYAFASTDDGDLQQWELFERSGKVDGLLVRTIPSGRGAGHCAVDDISSTLYFSEEGVGIWKLAAEPETDAQRVPVDMAAPHGSIAGEISALAVHRVDERTAYLLAAEAERLNLYSMQDDKLVGRVALRSAEGIAVAGDTLAVAEDHDDANGGRYRIVSWNAVAEGAGLAKVSNGKAATVAAAVAGAAPKARTVTPTVETDPVEDYGDAADDPAIWVHPTDPAKSLIIGTNKKRGLYVYDLAGKQLQSVPDGRMNNVDLRQGFRLQAGGEPFALVAASNRTNRNISVYKVDVATRRLSPVAVDALATGFRDPYGLCMYHSAKSSDFYVFVNNSDDGVFRQWRLAPRDGRVSAELVREFKVGSQAEGCAADDETGALYIAEEDVGLWRYSAEPDGGSTRTALDSVKGNLKADVEGVGIYHGAGGAGYLLVSNQGADNYALYRREGGNEFVGYFSVVANDELGIDGASETDGLEVTSAPLGPNFPRGAFVVQDGRNITPRARQNFKLVPWERIEALLTK